MKKIVFPGLVAALILLVFSYAVLFITIKLFPSLVEEYYNPIFYPGEDRTILYYLHPFILSFALAWFWERFKSGFRGNWALRGLELGAVYAIVATLPAMWITFSSMDVSLTMVMLWLAYGLMQASIAGLVFAKMNP